MPNPKHKHSKSRRDKRRTHFKTTMPAMAMCSSCGSPHLMHRVCPECGSYRGQQVFVKEESAS